MKSNNNIKLNMQDVVVAPLTNEICGGCSSAPRTHCVALDMRNNGITASVFDGCEECCIDFALRLSDSLPRGRGER